MKVFAVDPYDRRRKVPPSLPPYYGWIVYEVYNQLPNIIYLLTIYLYISIYYCNKTKQWEWKWIFQYSISQQDVLSNFWINYTHSCFLHTHNGILVFLLISSFICGPVEYSAFEASKKIYQSPRVLLNETTEYPFWGSEYLCRFWFKKLENTEI